MISLQQVWSSGATYDSEYSGGIQVCEVFVCNTHFLNISWHCVSFCLLIISLPGSDFWSHIRRGGAGDFQNIVKVFKRLLFKTMSRFLKDLFSKHYKYFQKNCPCIFQGFRTPVGEKLHPSQTSPINHYGLQDIL